MSEKRHRRDAPANIVEVWPYIDWLDRAVRKSFRKEPLISGPVFDRLSPDQKILAHWLCYTIDAQMDYRRLWTFGGPVIAELVEEYAARRADPLDLLLSFASEPKKRGGVARLSAKRQTTPENSLGITPRYSWMLFSIAVTLETLDRFDRSFMAYLAGHSEFLLSSENGQFAPRMAFLLDLLTYKDVRKPESRLSSKAYRTRVNRHAAETMALLKTDGVLENEFQAWVGKRFHKRLWANVRDYLKRGGEFYGYFQAALKQNGLGPLAKRIADNQEQVLVGLEVPGDVWNLLFFRRIFRTDKNISPKQLRSWFDGLREDGRLPVNTAVERLDVSFRFSPKMCDERREGCCLFREKSDIWDYCPPRRGVDWTGFPCPVTDHLCGIEYACDPAGCPVRQAVPKNLCQGCRINIREQRSAV